MDQQSLLNLINAGYSSRAIAKHLNKSQTTITYWLKKLNLATNHTSIGNTDFDYSFSGNKFQVKAIHDSIYADTSFWKDFQKYMDEQHTWAECSEKFNIPTQTISNAKKMGLINTRSQSVAIANFIKNETPEHKIYRSQQIRNGLKNSGKSLGGYRNNAGRSKKFKVIDSYGKNTTLQSSFEYKLYEILTEYSIKWTRPTYLTYTLKDKPQKYFPDFYLVDFNQYIDTKNDFLIPKDSDKIRAVEEQNTIIIHVLSEKQITWEYLNSHVLAHDERIELSH